MRKSPSTETGKSPVGLNVTISDCNDAKAPPVSESAAGAASAVAAFVNLIYFRPSSELAFFDASSRSSSVILNL
jgi:hypothetical protein